VFADEQEASPSETLKRCRSLVPIDENTIVSVLCLEINGASCGELSKDLKVQQDDSALVKVVGHECLRLRLEGDCCCTFSVGGESQERRPPVVVWYHSEAVRRGYSSRVPELDAPSSISQCKFSSISSLGPRVNLQIRDLS
jgi:hypothetical protein